MRERLGVPAVLIGVLVLIISMFGLAGTASADSMTEIPSFSDPRGAMPDRPGHIVKRARYGPFNVPANGQLHNAVHLSAPAPCSNCWITDMVPSLVYESDPNNANGTVANLNNNAMLHHFVLLNRQQTDVVCPGGLQGQFGRRFFAAGNERSQMHLPAPYGYNPGAATSFMLIYHLVNKASVAKNLSIEMVYQYRPTSLGGEDATPLWLDIDGCGDSEYTAPTGYSDTHADWTSNVNGRLLAINGHLHDVDITNASPCPDHCPALGHGIAVSAEIVGGPSSDYFGPVPPNNPPPADLTGATLCRSEGYYGTSWAVAGGNRWRGHLDTMSSCGINSDLLPGAQEEAFPADGEYTFEGYPLRSGQVVRLHSEYQNNTGQPQTDVMGIMMAFVAPQNPGYPRPKSASSVKASLVPAYNQCLTGSANRTHGPPLAHPSCNPPVKSSSHITIGTPDANGLGANSVGSARMTVIPGDAATTADEADVHYQMTVTDVRNNNPPNYTDYAGQLQLRTRLRILDRYNGPSEVGVMQDTDFNVTVPCATNSTGVGSACQITTTADTVLPGAVKESRRSVWAFGQVQVYDGGSDGVVSTTPNTLFAKQGIFTP